VVRAYAWPYDGGKTASDINFRYPEVRNLAMRPPRQRASRVVGLTAEADRR
jgi:hypothetical protein